MSAVHEALGLAFGERHFDEDGAAACFWIVEFVGGVIFATDDGPAVVGCRERVAARFDGAACSLGRDCFFGCVIYFRRFVSVIGIFSVA